MENPRRSFLKTASGVAGFFSLSGMLDKLVGAGFNEKINSSRDLSPRQVATDEEFWRWVQQSYTVSPNLINLNNGGVSPQPKVVQDAMIRFYQQSNEAPSYYMWHVLDENREAVRRDLALLAGCSTEEIAINRNATEALETVIFGLRLNPGDEVVLCKQDYPNMIQAWKQREKRDGIKLVWVNFELPIEKDDELVKGYTDAITAKTKIVHLTHIINWQGQIMPAKKIIAAAHAKGCEVLLDAAHSFAHFDFSLSDLNADYAGTSLHKWLGAPFGAGFLFVKKEKIKNLYPLFAHADPESADIRKFEVLGTRNMPIEQAIGQAMSFHELIGIERKEARLHYLKNYWAERALKLKGARIHTSLKPEYGCGIGMVSFGEATPHELNSYLFVKHRIHTVGIVWENISGVRITPNVYTLTSDLDRLLEALTLFSNGARLEPK